tara:strand:- start:484 stop:687 length:204 start_codon:yes stop_codon:yes gene_type:complete
MDLSKFTTEPSFKDLRFVLERVSSMTSKLRFFSPSSNEVRHTPFTEILAPFFRFLLKPFGKDISQER